MALEEKVSKAVKEIADSKYIKTIFPGLVEMQQEMGEQLIKNITKRNQNMAIQNTAEHIAMSAAGEGATTKVEQNLTKEIRSKLHADTIEEDITNVLKEYKQKYPNLKGDTKLYKEKAYDKTFNREQADIQKEAEETILGKIKAYPQAYFSNPEPKIRNTRIATAVGAYATATIVWYYFIHIIKKCFSIFL